MLSRAKSWHSGLSKVGKSALWVSTAVVAGTVISVGASPTPQKAIDQPKKETPAKVLSQNNEPKVEKKIITETEGIPFTESSTNDATLAVGTTKITIIGVNGVKTIAYEATYKDGVQTDKKKIQEEITTQPIAEVTTVGTKAKEVNVAPKASTPAPATTPTPTSTTNCDPNYTPCIPNYYGNALNCPDIHIMVHVIGDDHNRFDADGDGIGCEAYQ